MDAAPFMVFRVLVFQRLGFGGLLGWDVLPLYEQASVGPHYNPY